MAEHSYTHWIYIDPKHIGGYNQSLRPQCADPLRCSSNEIVAVMGGPRGDGDTSIFELQEVLLRTFLLRLIWSQVNNLARNERMSFCTSLSGEFHLPNVRFVTR